jgi:hypothetical protein
VPTVSILCPWCSWGAAIASGLEDEVARARAREMVVEHAAQAHPERIDEAAQNFESWLRADE